MHPKSTRIGLTASHAGAHHISTVERQRTEPLFAPEQRSHAQNKNKCKTVAAEMLRLAEGVSLLVQAQTPRDIASLYIIQAAATIP
ncbi:MAG: hypothetical protein AAF149_06680 [Bacteroidota bacterium]